MPDPNCPQCHGLGGYPICGECRNASVIDALPPPEIVEAAIAVETWMKKNHLRGWRFMGLCDRSFADAADAAERRRDAYVKLSGMNPVLKSAELARAENGQQHERTLESAEQG